MQWVHIHGHVCVCFEQQHFVDEPSCGVVASAVEDIFRCNQLTVFHCMASRLKHCQKASYTGAGNVNTVGNLYFYDRYNLLYRERKRQMYFISQLVIDLVQ